MCSIPFITRVLYVCGCFFLLLAACAAEPETAVPPTPLSPTTTTLPIATAVPPTVTEPAINTPTATAVAENTPTATPAATATAVVSTPFLDCLPDSLTAEAELTERAWQVTYVVDDQLWLRESGQAAIALVRQSGIYAVKLSADGALLAFARKSDENSSELWLVEGSGQSIRLSREGGIPGLVRFVAFSDDNRLVAFTLSADTEYTGDLWVAATDGSGVRQLVREDELMALADSEPGPGHVDFIHVAWVPGTHLLTYIPYLRYQGDYTQEAYDPLLSVDADTGEQSLFLRPGAGGYVTYSPDGTKMAVARPDKLSVMNVENRAQPLATLDYPILPVYLGSFIPQPVWENNSSSVLVTVPAEERLDPDIQPLPMAVWRLPVDGSPSLQVGQFNGDTVLYSSPDTKWVVYLVPHRNYAEQQWPTEVRLASTDLLRGTLIDNDFGGWDWGGWSPDSRYFVYQKADSDGFIQLILGNSCGDVIPLTEKSDSSFTQFVGWLDNQSFLLHRVSLQADGGGNWELWHGSKNGDLILVVAMGQNPTYDWLGGQGDNR